jgi:hypothetical protein
MKAFEEAGDRSKERCAVRKEASSSHLSRLSQSRKSLPQPQEIEIETTIEITIKQQETPGTADTDIQENKTYSLTPCTDIQD